MTALLRSARRSRSTRSALLSIPGALLVLCAAQPLHGQTSRLQPETLAQGVSAAAAPAVAASTGCPDVETPEANHTALSYHRHGLWPHLTRNSAGTDIAHDVHVVGGLLPT